jgi:hypothetical protein
MAADAGRGDANGPRFRSVEPPACVTEVGQFEAALHAANQAGSAAERAQGLAEAVDLYRGELLPGCSPEWVIPERQRLAEACCRALWLTVRRPHPSAPGGGRHWTR